jgi:Flp pilus assembly protein TadG
MVEFAFAGMLFFFMLVLVFEGARLTLTYFLVQNAAKEGARMGMADPRSSGDLTTIDTRIRNTVRAGTTSFGIPFVGSIPDGNITICRRSTPTSAGCTTNVDQISRDTGSVVEVTVITDFQYVPGAGGFLHKLGTTRLTGFHQTLIE